MNNLWPFTEPSGPLFYCRFYAYLTALVDTYVMKILDAVEAAGLAENTLIIRIADHGEMGMSHGGLRQKDYTAYEEVIRIPMIFSNPKLFPSPVETACPAGLIDVLPTLATLAGLGDELPLWDLQGHDLTQLFTRPDDWVQDHVLFTYDDQLLLPTGEGHIRCIREADWKFSLYFDSSGQSDNEYEMYDLRNDPTESNNLGVSTPLRYRLQFERLKVKLFATMRRTGTLPPQYKPPPAA